MKSYSILSPDAEADFDSACRWYERIDQDLVSRFELETLATISRIKTFPYQFPVIRGITRRALLKRFPYSIFFDLNRDGPFVIAVVHQRRSETIWLNLASGARDHEPYD